mgnify:CR=1 FL=1
MNETQVAGKWTEVKGELQKTWGKITGDEFETTKGDANAIVGLVQQRYGIAKEDASTRVSDVFKRYGAQIETKIENVKERISQSVEHAKQTLKK